MARVLFTEVGYRTGWLITSMRPGKVTTAPGLCWTLPDVAGRWLAMLSRCTFSTIEHGVARFLAMENKNFGLNMKGWGVAGELVQKELIRN